MSPFLGGYTELAAGASRGGFQRNRGVLAADQRDAADRSAGRDKGAEGQLDRNARSGRGNGGKQPQWTVHFRGFFADGGEVPHRMAEVDTGHRDLGEVDVLFGPSPGGQFRVHGKRGEVELQPQPRCLGAEASRCQNP